MSPHRRALDLIRTPQVQLCLVCQRLTPPVEGAWTCRAFPEGIPLPLWEGTADHRDPFDGDNGIRFEPDWLAPPEVLALLTVRAGLENSRPAEAG